MRAAPPVPTEQQLAFFTACLAPSSARGASPRGQHVDTAPPNTYAAELDLAAAELGLAAAAADAAFASRHAPLCADQCFRAQPAPQ